MIIKYVIYKNFSSHICLYKKISILSVRAELGGNSFKCFYFIFSFRGLEGRCLSNVEEMFLIFPPVNYARSNSFATIQNLTQSHFKRNIVILDAFNIKKTKGNHFLRAWKHVIYDVCEKSGTPAVTFNDDTKRKMEHVLRELGAKWISCLKLNFKFLPLYSGEQKKICKNHELFKSEAEWKRWFMWILYRPESKV